jgi:hypothetical protein
MNRQVLFDFSGPAFSSFFTLLLPSPFLSSLVIAGTSIVITRGLRESARIETVLRMFRALRLVERLVKERVKLFTL